MSQLRVSNVLVRALADVVQQRGFAPDRLLGHADRDPGGAEPEQSVSLAEFEALFERAVRLTGEPALGLHCGLYANESSFGLISPLVSHAPTLRHAIALAAQFQPLLVEGVRVRLAESSGVARLWCELECGPKPKQRSFYELVASGFVRALRVYGCQREDVHAVCFEYERPVYAHAYAAAFSGAERFGAGYTGVEFAAHTLNRPHLHRNPELQSMLLEQAERSLERRARPLSYAERARALMSTEAPSEIPDMAITARKLGLSVRSLRRRLEEEGTTYRELAQAMLQGAACTMLRNRELTFHDIAHALGFANPTAFHRAFRRWTKRTPAEYRTAATGSRHPEPAQG